MITLTQRAEQRLVVFQALDRGELVMAEAAVLLALSSRQIRRLRQGVRRRGPRALVHGNRGRPSPRRIPEAVRNRIIRLAKTTYAGVNHKHLSELLAEREALTVSHPTLHRILRDAGIRSPRRRRPPRHRRRRERMPQAGLLVQLDGSNHDWLQQRGPRLTLLAAIDDATGEVLAATFRDEEDAHGYFIVLRQLMQVKGIPVAVYSDRHGIFRQTRRATPTLREQLQGHTGTPTQIARALQELGIRWIPASSPQAKGRIERLFGTFQDRLRAELRLADVHDRDGANAFLRKFLPRFNRRFDQPPANPTPAYRPWPTGLDPQTVFCFKYTRIVSNDNTLTLAPHHIQLLPNPLRHSYAKAVVEAHERLDGSIVVFYRGSRVPTQQLTAVPPRDPIRARVHPHRQYSSRNREQRRGNGEIAIATPSLKRPELTEKETLNQDGDRRAQETPAWIPGFDHPWRHMSIRRAKDRDHRERTNSLKS